MTRRETTAKRAMMAAAPVLREHAEPPAPGWRRVLLRLVGLYLTGYRTIPAISKLFLWQVIAASGLGPAVLAIHGPGRRRIVPGAPRHGAAS
jgi:hypothetical protein